MVLGLFKFQKQAVVDVPFAFDLGAAVFADGREGTDLAGNPRISGDVIDLGCYERKATGMLVILR